jgi:hypothetical protein
MLTSTGLSDIVAELRRFRFQVQELAPEDTVSGKPGFQATRAGVTFRYDGTLYMNNEPVETPLGEFDISLHEMVHWFLNNFDRMFKYAAGVSETNPTDDVYLRGDEDIEQEV